MPITPQQAANTAKGVQQSASQAAQNKLGVAAIEGGSKAVHAYTVGASVYGGSADPGTVGDSGKYGALNGTMGFAVLGMGTDMGALAPLSHLLISYNGKTVLGQYLDIGLGGADVQGHKRSIDLWWETASALGFPTGVGLVTVARPDGKAIPGINGTPSNLKLSGPGGVAGSLDQTAVGAGNAVSSAAGTLTGALSFFGDIPHLLMVIGGVAIGLLALVEIGKHA